MGPWVREYRPNSEQSSSHCVQLKGKPAAATVLLFLTVLTEKCWIQRGLPLSPHQFLPQMSELLGKKTGFFFRSLCLI